MKKKVKQLVKSILWYLVPAFYRRTWLRPSKREFSISIFMGDSPFNLAPAEHLSNPVITRHSVTDVPARCVADPFMLFANDQWHLYFEVENHITMKGEIALATSANGTEWEYQQIILAEPWHLSYPYVFEYQGDYYMIPESGRNRSITLYKATDFPSGWSRVSTLLEGGRFADSSIFRYDNQWWMLVDAGLEPKSPVLRLYYATDLAGPWLEHPSSPVLDDNPHICRPGGRVLIVDGRPVRFAQDVYPEYGKRVYALEITQLTEDDYREKQVGTTPVLEAGNEAWNRNGMHHMDAHQLPGGRWMACVDGF